AQCLCGAISGGEMALGIVYGRVHGEAMNPKMFEHAKGLHDYITSICWYVDNFIYYCQVLF
ncbi:C-GCAxxG-C-C family protein, partial [Clostridioides difficile]|uniref:C-GCAxxG-C-C family protein n=1 Tax=Clostridioides difficile TaxID=1496 RepID=UPI001F1E0056